MDLNRRTLLLALLSLGAFSMPAPVWASDDDDDDRDDDDRDDRRSRRRFF